VYNLVQINFRWVCLAEFQVEMRITRNLEIHGEVSVG
jgi:hypothetical protein